MRCRKGCLETLVVTRLYAEWDCGFQSYLCLNVFSMQICIEQESWERFGSTNLCPQGMKQDLILLHNCDGGRGCARLWNVNTEPKKGWLWQLSRSMSLSFYAQIRVRWLFQISLQLYPQKAHRVLPVLWIHLGLLSTAKSRLKHRKRVRAQVAKNSTAL